MGSLKDRLDRLRSVRTNQAADFIDDLTSYRVGPVHGARDRDCNEQNGRDSEQCVIGERSAQARDVVFGPALDGVPQKPRQQRQRDFGEPDFHGSTVVIAGCTPQT